LQAIDGMLIDGPYFGFERADSPTRGSDAEPLLAAARLLRGEGRRCLAIDYCQDAKQRGEASRLARQAGLVEYIDGDGNRRLDHIPTVPPASENPRHIGNLAAADNFLPLLSADAFARKDQWIGALAATNYDLLLVDPFFRGQSLTLAEVAALRFKRLGSQRLFLAPLPVGFAATDRFYWQAGWHSGMPDWVGPQDPDRPDHYLASYWLDSWKKLLGSYVTGLCDLGIDGIVFDGADSYLFFEAMLPF
jgi:cysteinyl-tRNA synthetase